MMKCQAKASAHAEPSLACRAAAPFWQHTLPLNIERLRHPPGKAANVQKELTARRPS
jgi:hypothetical protein